MKEKLIDEKDIAKLHPIFRGKLGKPLMKFLFAASGANKVNGIYDSSKSKTGIDFATGILDYMGIVRRYVNYEVLDQYFEGSFITVSNHPYGHIDGIMGIEAVGKKRKDYKVMVNWLLSHIDTMSENFIGVNPYKGNKMEDAKSSLGGVKLCIEHLNEGHPMGFFPAGGVSDPSFKEAIDREWQTPVLKLIKRAKCPIIPMYFSGQNSWFYQFLGHIDWRIRTGRLLHETMNKKGKTITVVFGEPISVEEQSKYKNIEEFGEFLKAKTYELKTQV